MWACPESNPGVMISWCDLWTYSRADVNTDLVRIHRALPVKGGLYLLPKTVLQIDYTGNWARLEEANQTCHVDDYRFWIFLFFKKNFNPKHAKQMTLEPYFNKKKKTLIKSLRETRFKPSKQPTNWLKNDEVNWRAKLNTWGVGIF